MTSRIRWMMNESDLPELASRSQIIVEPGEHTVRRRRGHQVGIQRGEMRIAPIERVISPGIGGIDAALRTEMRRQVWGGRVHYVIMISRSGEDWQSFKER